MTARPDPIRIYVGADRSQMLAFKVLAHSIRARSERRVEIAPLIDLDLPEPADPRQRARTGFSFARFAIPALAGRQGHAVYLDADMLVLKDIADLWSLPLNGAKVMCQEAPPEHIAATAPKPGARRRKQCSVMLLDCAALDWDASEIIAGLGPAYTYEELLDDLYIVNERDVSYAIPTAWNSLEHLGDDTCLIHYTDMMTQPWVFAGNRNGWAWVGELRRMVASGAIGLDEIEAEIAAGFVRPSLTKELALPEGPPCAEQTAELGALDGRAGFRAHAGLRPDGLRARAAEFIRRAAARMRPFASPKSTG